MAIKNLKTLSRYSESLSQVYLEHAVVEQENYSIAAFTDKGRVTLPVANLSALILGPGTRITHAAIKTIASCGAVVIWTGAEESSFYASGQSKSRSSGGIERLSRRLAFCCREFDHASQSCSDCVAVIQFVNRDCVFHD